MIRIRINLISWPVSQKINCVSRFPLGDLAKPRVRERAKQIGLAVADKKDSQGICFLGKVKVPEFLSPINDNPDEIVTVDGKKVGEHKDFIVTPLSRRGWSASNTDNENYVVT